MAKDLPEFKKSVGIQPAGAVDVESRLNTTSRVLDQFSKTALATGQKEADIAAAQAGEEAGATPGFTGQLAPGATEATRAFNKAALAANKMQNYVNIRTGIQNIADGVNQNFKLGSTAIAQKELQAYGESILPNIPAQNRVAAQNIFQFESANVLNSISRKERVLSTNTAGYHIREGNVIAQNEANNKAFWGQPIAAQAISGQIGQSNNATVDAEEMTPQVRDTLKEGRETSINMQGFLGGGERAIDNGKMPEYLKGLVKNGFGVLKAEDQAQVNLQFLGMEQQHNLSNKLRQDAASNFGDEQNFAKQHGLYIDPVSAARWKQEYPQQAAANLQNFVFSKLYGTVMGAMRYATASERSNINQIAQEELARLPADFPRQQFITAIVRGSKQQSGQLLADSYAYVENSPHVQDANSARQVSLQARAEANPTGPDGTGLMWPVMDSQHRTPLPIDPIGANLNMQRAMGVPEEKLRVTSNAKAAGIVQQINALPPNERIQDLQSVVNSYGPYGGMLLRDLHNHGLDFSSQAILSAAQNMASRHAVPDMIIATNETGKEAAARLSLAKAQGLKPTNLNADVASALTSWTDSIRSLTGNTGPLQERTNAMVQRLALVYMTNKGQSASEAAQNAANDYVLNNFQFVSQAGAPVLRVAIGHDKELVANSVHGLISQATSQDLRTPADFKLGFFDLNEGTRQQNYKNFVRTTAHLVSTPATDGVVLVDGNGNVVLNAAGQRIQATYKQIENPTDDLNTIATAEESRISRGQVIIRGTEIGAAGRPLPQGASTIDILKDLEPKIFPETDVPLVSPSFLTEKAEKKRKK